MKRNRHTEGQITQHLQGPRARRLDCRARPAERHDRADIYRWKAKYSGVVVSEAKRLRELEAENDWLKELLAESALDNAALKENVSGKW